MIAKNIAVNEKGNLTFAGYDTVELKEKYGTPLYLLDEERIRENCRIYKTALAESLGESALPLYAGKALCILAIYKIMAEEKMGIDVVSPGEIYTAKTADFPMERAYFHGNNKTDADIAFWSEVFETHRKVVGSSTKPKSVAQITKWLKNPHSDSAEYKMWGNGVALPCVFFVLAGIVWAAEKDT